MRSCYRCKGGTYQSNSKASQCTPCALGMYATGNAMTACHSCKPGTAKPYPASKYTCNICLGGTYQSAFEASTCLACAVGSYTTGQAATACAPYPPKDCNGTAGGTAVVGCDNVCGSGRVIGGCDRRCGSAVVKGCDSVCGSGSLIVPRPSPTVGPRQCFPCPGNATCPTPDPRDLVCIAGFFRAFFDFGNSDPSSKPCLPCPPGSTSPAGSGSINNCSCRPPMIQYDSDRGPDCRPCPPHAAACPTTSAFDIVCAAGYFFALENDGPDGHPLQPTCRACPDGTNSTEGRLHPLQPRPEPDACLCLFGTYGPPAGPCKSCTLLAGGCIVFADCQDWFVAVKDQCIDGKPCKAAAWSCSPQDYFCGPRSCANCSTVCPEGYIGALGSGACRARQGQTCPAGSASHLGFFACRCLPGLYDASEDHAQWVKCRPCPARASCSDGTAACEVGYGLNRTWDGAAERFDAECSPCPNGELECWFPTVGSSGGQAERRFVVC
jgi:hypothetical protein